MDNIVRLENIVQSALIWIKGLIYKLHHLGINGHMLSWLKSFLTGRTAQVLLSGSRSELFSCLNGSPQGSVISPLLFIILVNDIASKHRKCLTGMYADDMFIWMKHKNLKFLQNLVSSDVQEVIEEFRLWGFLVASSKTGAIAFSLLKIPDNLTITVDGAKIPVKKELKILGITLDSRLNWCKHIMEVANKCSKVINLLRLLSGTRWGAHAKPQLAIY